jgi:hypothetical protein
MAFNPSQSQQNPRNENWKADAFLNVYLPTTDGRGKIGAIPLRVSREREAQMIEWLRKDPANLEKLAGNGLAIYEFVDMQGQGNNGFILE